jgi:hypothetical protein
VVGFYYANSYPSTGRREFWVMTLDIRAPSANLQNTVTAFTNNSPIYDVIDCMNVTDYIWGKTSIGGVYTGADSAAVYMTRPFYDLKSKIIAMPATVNSLTIFPNLSTVSNPSSDVPPMLAFFKIAEDGTISHHNSPIGNGWAIEYYNNQDSSGYTIPAGQRVIHLLGNTAYSAARVYQRPIT